MVAKDTIEDRFFNPLSPNSDKNEISPYMITACSNIQVKGIKETITLRIRCPDI